MVTFEKGVVLLAVAGFEGVRFDHEQGVAVPGGNLGGFPRQQVVVDVGGVSGHPFQCAVRVGEHQAVEYADHRPVRAVVLAADVHRHQITVGDFFAGVVFR